MDLDTDNLVLDFATVLLASLADESLAFKSEVELESEVAFTSELELASKLVFTSELALSALLVVC